MRLTWLCHYYTRFIGKVLLWKWLIFSLAHCLSCHVRMSGSLRSMGSLICPSGQWPQGMSPQQARWPITASRPWASHLKRNEIGWPWIWVPPFMHPNLLKPILLCWMTRGFCCLIGLKWWEGGVTDWLTDWLADWLTRGFELKENKYIQKDKQDGVWW